MLGSWEVKVTVGELPEKVATAFAALSEQLIGCEYTPIAYLGSQVVNGTNHAVLAEQVVLSGRDTKNIVLVIFNEKGMECTLVDIERVVEGGNGSGAVEVNPITSIPEEARALFESSFAGFVGSNVKPFALLATQVVKGINYMFAAEVTSVTATPETTVALVTVNNLVKSIAFVDLLK